MADNGKRHLSPQPNVKYKPAFTTSPEAARRVRKKTHEFLEYLRNDFDRVEWESDAAEPLRNELRDLQHVIKEALTP